MSVFILTLNDGNSLLNFQTTCKLLCKFVHLFCMQNHFAESISFCKCLTSQLTGKSFKLFCIYIEP